MHGAHPARLAFKLRDLSLFLLRTFLPPSPSRIADRSLSLSLAKRRRATPFPTVFQLRH